MQACGVILKRLVIGLLCEITVRELGARTCCALTPCAACLLRVRIDEEGAFPRRRNEQIL